MRVRSRPGSVVVDLQAVQSPTSRSRGVGRFAINWAQAIERLDDRAVGQYLLSSTLPPPGELGGLVSSGKLAYANTTPLPRDAAIYHVLSPLDTALRPTAVWPSAIAAARLRMSAMVYDLIPALDPETELADPPTRRRYRLLLEALRSVEHIQTLSTSAAADCVAVDLRPRSGIVVIGGAPAERFVPPDDRARVAAEVARVLGCSSRYVFAPSGSHPRKNNERLVEAFASLPPAVRGDLQLLIGGAYDEPTRVHYDALAAARGAPGCVFVPGYLSDELQLLCFQGAELVCVASLAEGLGLPVVEAFAAGARVVASDRPPLDELVSPTGRFDPMSVASISSVLASALEGNGDLSTPHVPLDSWNDVAERSLAGFDEIASVNRPVRFRRSSHRHRRRLAFVTPLPPAPTGIAGYSARLIQRIVATDKVDLDVYWDGEVAPPASTAGIPTLRHVRSLEAIEALTGRYDDVVFTLGNSHHHLGALDVLLRRGGSVLAHDVRLTNLYRHRHGDPGRRPHGLERAIREMYGTDLPDGLGHLGELDPATLEQYGLLMAREAIDAAELFFVTTRSALGLAELDARPGGARRILQLPFAIGQTDPGLRFVDDVRPAPGGLEESVRAGWGTAPPGDGRRIIAHFGIVDPAKRPHTLIGAIAGLGPSGADCTLAFVGPVSDDLAVILGRAAAAVGIADRTVITGPLPPERYAAWMTSTTVAVQLRSGSNGEASAAIGECLATGIPTVTSETGWATELPDDTVELVPTSVTEAVLSDRIAVLLANRTRRVELVAGGHRFAGTCTFDRMARELLSALEYRAGPRALESGRRVS